MPEKKPNLVQSLREAVRITAEQRASAPTEGQVLLAIATGTIAWLAWQSVGFSCSEERAISTAEAAVHERGREEVTPKNFIEIVKRTTDLLREAGIEG